MIPTTSDLSDFLKTVDDKRKDDIKTLLVLFEELSGYKPVMWGSIVGFGHLHYTYKSGHQGEMPLIGFANRKQAITLYILNNTENYPLLAELGKHKTSKACIYINKLEDIDLSILKELVLEGISDTLNQEYIKIIK